MNLFLAWIIVGFCGYLINRNTRNSLLGKYGLVKVVQMDRNEKISLADAEVVRSTLEVVLGILMTVVAPLAVWVALRDTFAKKRYAGTIAKVAKYDATFGTIE